MIGTGPRKSINSTLGRLQRESVSIQTYATRGLGGSEGRVCEEREEDIGRREMRMEERGEGGKGRVEIVWKTGRGRNSGRREGWGERRLHTYLVVSYTRLLCYHVVHTAQGTLWGMGSGCRHESG